MLNLSRRLPAATLTLLRRILLVLTLSLALAAAGVILSLRYSVLPDIERFHNDITDAAARAIGHAVEIDKIEADWRGIGPHLRLSGIRILDTEKRTMLALQRVDVVVSWMTLLSGELRLASLEIDQPDLLVKRDVQGVLQISGITMGEKSADNKFVNMLLNQSRIVVRGAHISWLDEKLAKPLLEFNEVYLLLENGWNYHRFAMRAIPPGELATQLDVRGDLYGKSFDDLQDWSGEIYTQFEYADLAAWKSWLPLPDALKQGKGALRGWLEVEGGKIIQLTADLALLDVQTRLASDLPPLDIRVLSGRMGWREIEQGFEISTRKLSLRLFDDFVLKPTDVLLRLSNLQNAASSSGEMRANLLELEGLGKLMEYLPIEHEYKTRFTEFSPQGRVENLQAQWQTDDDRQLHYKVKGKFGDLSLQRVGNLPGFSGLSGEVEGNESRGTLTINSRKLKLDAPQLMPEQLAFDTLSAHSSWGVNSGELEVKLRNVVLSNSDIAGTAYGSYQTLANSPGKLDLNLHLTRASVSQAGKYIPKIALGADAQTWIAKSLLDGQSNDFNLRIKGDLKKFPFVDNREGIFKIHARAQGVALDYEAGWPLIDNASADLLIQGKELVLTASSAMTAGVHLKNVRVKIPDVLSKDLMLLIRGEAEAENARALEYIQASPVHGYIDGFTDDIEARGNGKLNLALDIPLRGEQPLKVSGSYRFRDSEVDFDKNLPVMRKVNGDLAFTGSGVSTQNITAQILGGPATLAIESSEGGAMNIKLGGRANFATLSGINPHPLLRKLTGEPAWKLEIGVQNKLSKVILTSSLKGLQSELPAPFSKQAGEDINLRMEIYKLNAKRLSLTLQYGALLNANLLSRKDEEGAWEVERGIINFGNVAHKADRKGLWVMGTLPHVSLEGWGELTGAMESEAESAPISITGADLLIQKLAGFGNSIDDLQIKASTRNDILTAQLSSKKLNGELSWQDRSVQSGEHGRLVARLRNLDLENLELGKPPTGLTDASDNGIKVDSGIKVQQKADAVDLPMLDLSVDRLSFKGRQLGRFELLAQHHEQNYQLDHLRLSNPDSLLSMNGKWNTAADAADTRVNIKLDINNAGNVLAQYGYPNSVKNGKGKMEGTFTWPGTPMMYSKASLNGNLSMDTVKGQFLQIDPGIGKLLSILSLQALPKRITLDFEDVFSKGFEFDKITGSADIKQGVIFTDNLKIEGSSAKVAMTGKIDLANETQNLRVRIVPTVGNSVALISALVATPIVGAGVYLAGKILNDPLGQLVSFEYNITGNWVDPKVEKISAKKPDEQPQN